jgi:hypothetical protein
MVLFSLIQLAEMLADSTGGCNCCPKKRKLDGGLTVHIPSRLQVFRESLPHMRSANWGYSGQTLTVRMPLPKFFKEEPGYGFNF